MRAIRKERIRTGAMQPLLEGGYRESEYAAFAWQCAGCGLVWEKRWHAESCEKHGHKPVFTQMYCDGTLNGQPVRPRYYARHALRREPVAA